MKPNSIRYLHNSKTGIELIFCGNSTISYPTHNHVSVLTIGIILDGSIVLTTDQDAKTYSKSQTFIIPPYVPHSISAQGSYTMLSLCIDKHMIPQISDRLEGLVDCSVRHSDNQNPFIQNLKRQLETTPETRLSVDDMAREAFVSKYHFIRCFKDEVGLTPHQFQIQNRIRKAKRLLHTTETITEVALTTGFYDQSHFIKQFEKQVGMSPFVYKLSSEYR